MNRRRLLPFCGKEVRLTYIRNNKPGIVYGTLQVGDQTVAVYHENGTELISIDGFSDRVTGVKRISSYKR